MTAREIKYIAKALSNFRIQNEGQFGQSSSCQPEETKDGAVAINFLLEECAQRRRDYNNLLYYLQTAHFKVPECYEQDMVRMEKSEI
jgi:hypothetical protein